MNTFASASKLCYSALRQYPGVEVPDFPESMFADLTYGCLPILMYLRTISMGCTAFILACRMIMQLQLFKLHLSAFPWSINSAPVPTYGT